MNFVHLHNHSHYSLLDGLAKIPDLVAKTKELGMNAVALTDHGVMYGAVEFYKECRHNNVKPIIGMESYIAPRKLTDKKPGVDTKLNHLLLLVKNEVGYKNLIKLTSKAHIEGFYYKPRIDNEYLKEHSAGLIAASACLKGKIPQLLLENKYDEAKEVAFFYQKMFGKGNFYLELEHHPEIAKQTTVNELLIKLSKDSGIPLILTKDAHYLDPQDNLAQDAMVCIQTGKTVEDKKRLDMTSFNVAFIPPADMIAYAKELGVPEAATNTVKIAEQCNLELDLTTWHFPKFDLPQNTNSADYLTELTYNGLKKREGKITAEDKARLDYELDIIISKKYDDYFLIVADFMNWAHEQGIIATTRGSASGSLVSYAIGITSVNPLRFQLPFERFLTKKRPTPPDIDCDIQDSRRDEVIDYVRNKYGKRQVANIGTFGTMKARAAVRDITRVLGFPYSLGDKIAKMIPQGPQGTHINIAKAKQINPELKNYYESDPQVKKILDLAQRIEGCVRHVSVHAAGVVIAPTKLTDYLPLQREPKGEQIITQYDMHAVDPNVEKETVGLLKADFLGIRNLSILGIAREIVKHTKQIDINLDKIPWNDKKTFALLSQGRTMGVFQLSSSGMTRYLKELEPDNIYDIMAMVALYRPGPMEIIPEYIKRKRDPSSVTYPHPKLKDILERTYGLLIYQDDVMLTAMTLAGYDAEEADKFRKAMGKKIKELMAKQKLKFIEGCKKNELTEAKAQEIWGYIEPFAGYGFNKCLTGDTQIVNPNTGQIKTIEEIYKQKNNNFALSLNLDNCKLESKKIPKIYSNGKKMVWEIITRTGRKIKATGNHPFLKFNQWTNLSDLKIGDKIAVTRKISYQSKYKINNYKLATLGYLLAEGNLCHPYGVYFYSTKKDELSDYSQSTTKFKNIKLTPNINKRAISLYTTQIDQTKGNPLMQWIKELGLWHKKATEKFFPDFVFELNSTQLSLLLGKLWQGSGCIHADKHGQIFYSTSSEKLARQLQHLLLRLEIISTVHTKKFKYRQSFKYGYIINISKFQNINKFSQTIGQHLIGDKKKALQKIIKGTINLVASKLNSQILKGYAQSDIYWDEITNIKKIGIKQTYDLTIPGNHNFIANDFIVHNSHSASYAVVAYQTAYMKANYTAEFMAALMTAESGNTDKIAEAVAECERMNIKVLPPNINQSLDNFTYISDNEIRFGLMAIKNLGEDIIQAIIKERKENGAFKSLEDLLKRVHSHNLNKKSLEALIKAGAMDDLGERNQMLSNMNKILAFLKTNERERNTGQFSLFGLATSQDNGPTLILDPAEPAPEKEKLMWEKELLGLYVSSHPFKTIAPYFAQNSADIKDILNNSYSPNSTLQVAGIISHVHKIFTKRNELMMFVTIEDLTGSLEIIVFPKLLQKDSSIWQEDKFIFAKGKLSDKDDVPKILVDTATEIDPANPDALWQNKDKQKNLSEKNQGKLRALNIMISINYKNFNTSTHSQLKKIFIHAHGKNRVFLLVSQNDSTRKIATNFYIDFNNEIKQQIENITGANSVTFELINNN